MQIEEKTNLLILKFAESKGNKERCKKKFQDQRRSNRSILKFFRNATERTELFQSFSGTNRNRQRSCKLFRSEKEQTEVIQSFSGMKKNKRICSQKCQIVGKRTDSIVNWPKKRRKKDYSSCSFRTKAKTNEINLKKDEVLTLLLGSATNSYNHFFFTDFYNFCIVVVELAF